MTHLTAPERTVIHREMGDYIAACREADAALTTALNRVQEARRLAVKLTAYLPDDGLTLPPMGAVVPDASGWAAHGTDIVIPAVKAAAFGVDA